MLIAATTRPDASRIGAAIEATPISRSSTASDQPRARIRASSVRSTAGSVIDFGVICASGEAAASTRSSSGSVRCASSVLPEDVVCTGTRRPVSLKSRSVCELSSRSM